MIHVNVEPRSIFGDHIVIRLPLPPIELTDIGGTEVVSRPIDSRPW